jgi:hypothetical protein
MKYIIKIKLFVIISAFVSLNAFSVTYNQQQNDTEKGGRFQKTLDYYRNNPQKYKAACFLIDNMNCHFSQTYHWVNAKRQTVSFNEFDYSTYEDAVEAFNKISSVQKLTPVEFTTPDFTTVKSDYLIDNVETAFVAYRSKWAKNLSFEMFCEYILPYRIMDEPLTNWRNSYSKFFEKSFKRCEALKVRDICTLLSNEYKSWFSDIFNLNLKKENQHVLSAQQILFRRQGYCEDMANWGVFMLRSLGIASTVDYTPFWATSTGGHFWQVAFDENGKEIPFFMGDDTPAEFFIRREPSKVLRITFSEQPQTIASRVDTAIIPAGFLRMKNLIDVTEKYWKTFNFSFALNRKFVNEKVVYLSVFNGAKWRIVWWARNNNGKPIFEKMTCGVVYLPMVYKTAKEIPAAAPLLLKPDGKVEILQASTGKLKRIIIPQKQNYLIFRENAKYSLYYWDRSGKWQLLGTKIPETTINPFTTLIFDNVPSNALYVLIPQYSQGKERPFTVDDSGNINYW